MSDERKREGRPTQQGDPQSSAPLTDITARLPTEPLVTIGEPPGAMAPRPLTSDVPPLEKLKYYTDLYKFYFELPFKIFAAYSAASTLTLAITAYFTRELSVVGWVAGFIVAIGITVGVVLDRAVDKQLEEPKAEVEKLLNELDIKLGPNFQMMRFVTRFTVVLLVAFPLVLFLVLYFFYVK